MFDRRVASSVPWIAGEAGDTTQHRSCMRSSRPLRSAQNKCFSGIAFQFKVMSAARRNRPALVYRSDKHAMLGRTRTVVSIRYTCIVYQGVPPGRNRRDDATRCCLHPSFSPKPLTVCLPQLGYLHVCAADWPRRSRFCEKRVQVTMLTKKWLDRRHGFSIRVVQALESELDELILKKSRASK